MGATIEKPLLVSLKRCTALGPVERKRVADGRSIGSKSIQLLYLKEERSPTDCLRMGAPLTDRGRDRVRGSIPDEGEGDIIVG